MNCCDGIYERIMLDAGISTENFRAKVMRWIQKQALLLKATIFLFKFLGKTVMSAA